MNWKLNKTVIEETNIYIMNSFCKEKNEKFNKKDTTMMEPFCNT